MRPTTVSHNPVPPTELSAVEQVQLPMRLMLSVLVAVVYAAASGQWLAAVIWYALAAGTLTAAALLHRRLLTRAPQPWSIRWTASATAVLAALISAGLAPCFWLFAGPLGPIYAVVLLTAGSLNVLVVQHRQLHPMLISLAPYAMVFCTLPVLAYRDGGAAAAIGMAIGVAAFMTNGAMLWRVWAEMVESERLARDELERRRVEAEAAVAAKSAFVAAVSHELRTPISGVLAAAAELERDVTDPRLAECAAIVGESGRFMRTLLGDLLDFSKIEAGRMGVETTPFDLKVFAREVTRFWGLEAEKQGRPLRFHGCAEAQGWYAGDPLRLRQIVNNLLSNALKFTGPEGVRLVLSADPAASGATTLTVQVIDTGTGIAPNRLARLFTPFDQTDVSIARTHGGTGLGLAISRELARLMGGDLTVSSPPGAGATFTLSVALQPAATPQTEDAPIRVAEPVRPMRVLVADDHEINRRLLALLLLPLAAEVTTAENGLQALQIAGLEAFDLILIDVVMPEMDGREAVRRLRALDGPNRTTPVIGVTGGDTPEDMKACAAAGMTACIAKPLVAEALYAAIDLCLAEPAAEALAA